MRFIDLREAYGAFSMYPKDDVGKLQQKRCELGFLLGFNEHGPYYINWTLVALSYRTLSANSLHQMWWATEAVEQYGQSLDEEERQRRALILEDLKNGLNVSPFLRFSLEIIQREAQKPTIVIYERLPERILAEVFRTNQISYGF